jgi:hypothetical protein
MVWRYPIINAVQWIPYVFKFKQSREHPRICLFCSCWTPKQHLLPSPVAPGLPVSSCSLLLMAENSNCLWTMDPIMRMWGSGKVIRSCRKRSKHVSRNIFGIRRFSATDPEKIEYVHPLPQIVLEPGTLAEYMTWLGVDGYPRDEIDIFQARTLRERLAVIRTDHKALMKDIEQGLMKISALKVLFYFVCACCEAHCWYTYL